MTIWSRLLVATCALGAAAVAVSAQSGTNGAYHAPRTPWGDPDLQGNYTTLSEAGTPLERPKEFEGRNMNDVSPEERARLKREAAERTIGRFLGPAEAPDNWWQPAYGKFAEGGAQLWLIVDPADGKIPPLTAAAQARQAARAEARRRNTRGPADSWTDRSLYDRCITRGFPSSGMPTIYGNSSQIIQGPGYVAIVYEMIHDTRMIPLDPSTSSGSSRAESRDDGRPHLRPSSQSDFGDSRGRWEGETLVVETTNFRDRSVYMNATPDRLTITERFTRVSPRQVRWSVTMDDPTTWTAPWTFALPLTLDDSEPLQLYECHEGNYGLKNILSAARAEERNAAGGEK